MTIQELFIQSNEELKKIIDQIDDQQWGIEMPAGTTSQPATLQQSVSYHAYDDAWVPDVLDGKTKQEIGDKYDAILTTKKTELLTVYAKYNTLAIQKVRGYDDLNKIVHLSYGDFSAHDYLQHIVIFRAFRAYDIAKLIGVNARMSGDLVQGLWDEFTPVVESYRQMGVFPPAIEVPKDSSLQTKLLGLVGRN